MEVSLSDICNARCSMEEEVRQRAARIEAIEQEAAETDRLVRPGRLACRGCLPGGPCMAFLRPPEISDPALAERVDEIRAPKVTQQKR